ncbi:hypothetical protein [Lewinella sp. W8]|uniref:hypothetical protein n=1 Tax=Lewinella sp. W8 TaxID=2528208 RepID=UPI0010683F04|nr:hypothetical protein [Lewinella sp. W8]MTB50524.1 hypothetical protein [Lewinella sp. W8]
MKAHLNLIVIMLALTASLYLGWRVTQPELTGHWHVHPAYQTSQDGLSGVHHFKINGNGEVRINEVLDEEYAVTGYVDKLFLTMHLRLECWYESFQYRIRGDRMDFWYEDGEHSRWRPVAHRFRPGDCDPEQDYFIDLPISITLPRDTMGEYPVIPVTHKHLTFQVGRDRFNSEIKALAAGYRKILDQDGLKDLIRQHSLYVPPSTRDLPAVAIIYKDASITPDELRTALTDDLQTITNLDGYYLAHRNPNEEGLALTFRWVAF